jgi:hypothetical protein
MSKRCAIKLVNEQSEPTTDIGTAIGMTDVTQFAISATRRASQPNT